MIGILLQKSWKAPRLIEPMGQKAHWTDYLKQNYLCGQAFALVDHEKTYNIIWTRLHESYGNSRLHLQNKLSGIDKIDGL